MDVDTSEDHNSISSDEDAGIGCDSEQRVRNFNSICSKSFIVIKEYIYKKKDFQRRYWVPISSRICSLEWWPYKYNYYARDIPL